MRSGSPLKKTLNHNTNDFKVYFGIAGQFRDLNAPVKVMDVMRKVG